MTRGFPLVLACALGLAACGDDAADAPAEGDERGARGEVLGGTISDDMIPLDQLKSRAAPQTPSSPAPSTGGGGAAPAAGASEAAESAPTAASAPASDDTVPELPED